MRFKNVTLAKYLLSYFAVLLVSFAGFYFILNYQLKGEYAHTYRNEVEQKISNYSAIVSQNFSSIHRTDDIINNDTILIDARYVDDRYQRYLAVNELKKLSNANSLISNILYIDIKNCDILSSYSACYYGDGNYYIKTANGDILIPRELLTTSVYDNTIYPLEGRATTLYLFLCPVNSKNYRTLYLLNEISIKTLLKLYTVQEISSVGLVCQNSLVYSTDAGIFAPVDFSAQEIAENRFIELDGDNDLYLSRTSNPKLKIAVCINKAYLNNYIVNVFTKTHFVTFLLFLLGIILVFFALRATYLPLSKLMKRITQNNAYKIHNMDTLEQAFDDSIHARNMLESKLVYYQRMIKKSVLQNSSALSNAAMADLDQNIELLFQENFQGAILIAILSFHDGGGPARMDFSAVSSESSAVLTVLDCSSNQAALLICFPSCEKDASSKVLPLLNRIQVAYPCQIAYSDTSTNPMDIAYLYFMAQLAQKYAGSKQLCSYASIRSFVNNQPSDTYPYQIVDTLTFYLKHFDFEEAHATVDELFQFIDSTNSPTIFTRCILVDTLMYLNTEMNACAIKFEHYKEQFHETLRLCRYAPYEESRAAIRKNIHQIIQLFSNEASNTGINMSQILRFAEANCLRSDFSLTYLADHFHISSVYLSTLFTKKLKITFSDYVWNYRLETAKNLLETTDKPIDQICSAVGYDVPHSFRRKFKQEVGLSPSEYRKHRSQHTV